jgi:hypothetical protein
MRILKSAGVFRFLFFSGERVLLQIILDKMCLHYQIPLDQLGEGVRNQWMHLEGIVHSGFESEQEYWEEHWESLRSERETLCVQWKEELQQLPFSEKTEWQVKEDQAENLLKIFNDHRLLTACREGLTQQDMAGSFQDLHHPGKQQGLLEVDFLAYLMELLLEEMNGSQMD